MHYNDWEALLISSHLSYGNGEYLTLRLTYYYINKTQRLILMKSSSLINSHLLIPSGVLFVSNGDRSSPTLYIYIYIWMYSLLVNALLNLKWNPWHVGHTKSPRWKTKNWKTWTRLQSQERKSSDPNLLLLITRFPLGEIVRRAIQGHRSNKKILMELN